MADEKKEFIVPVGLYTAAFDLDYTQNEIKDTQKLYEKDDHFINRTTLRALVTEHPFFAKFFHWQRYDTPYKPPNPHAPDEDETACRKRGNSIPAELFSFFKLYMMEVRSEKRKSMAVRKGKVPEGMEDSFYKRLLDYAHAEEEKSASCDSEIYWTRCLYGNEHFQRTAVRNLWDEEYMLRTRCLYEKVKHLPPEQQLAMFQDVVHYLDDGITKASQMKEDHGDVGHTQESGLEGFLDEFPKQVITHCRKRTASKHRDKRVTYTVEDLKLQLDADRRYREITSLERAMKWIRGNTDGSLKVKEAARKAYLRRLNQNTPKSKFQKEYEASCEYVNACTTKISPGELREKIASRAAAYYGSAFRGAIAIPGYYLHDQNDTWKKSEIDRLIEEHVVRAYSLFYYQFKNYLEFINGSRTDRDDFAAQIADMAHFAWDNPNAPEDEQAYQYRLTGYLNYLGAVMPKALSHSFILGTPVNVEQQQVLVGHIAELCVQTCEKLGIRVEEWADADRLDTVIIRYNMHGYNLMQAIARVNRVFQDKEGGLVVDYVGIASALKAAMKEYSARDRAKYAADMFYADVTGGHGYEMFYNSKATDGHYWSLDTDKALQCAAYIAKQDGSWQKAKNAEDILSEYAVADESAYEDYARTEWIKQHMDYAASDEFEHEIVGGYNDRMMVVFRDALDDEDIKSYETRKTISAMLNLDVELSEADMYELIIAEILYGERGQHITEEAYNQNLRNSVANVAKVLVNMATSGDTAKEIPSDVLDSINESYELLQTLEFGSEEYGNTYSKFVSLLKGNVKELKSKLKTELADDAAFTGLGIVIDGAFEQYEALEDILSYINNYVAYQSTSKQLHDVLGHLLVVIYMHQGNVQFRFCANIQFVKGTE